MRSNRHDKLIYTFKVYAAVYLIAIICVVATIVLMNAYYDYSMKGWLW